MSFEFSAENKKRIAKILTRYPTKQAAILPVLWLAQKQHGYLSLEVQEHVAEVLGLSPAQVYGVSTFYTMFKQKPSGRYHLQVCRTLPCALMGCETIIRHLKEKYGLTDGAVTDDGKFSLQLVECLASCGTGPMMQVNETYFENLTTEKVDQLLERLRKG